MIIGIGGKMGSGKNLVCDIIQYLTAEDCSSKCINRIKKGLSIKGHHNSKFEQKAFAGKLKQIASLLTGINVKDFEHQEFKKVLLGEEWATVRPNPLNAITPFADIQFNELMSVREFLQKLGTEAIRNGLHVNAWVNALVADYNFEGCKNTGESCETPNGNCDSKHCYPNWILTDMRFPNELEAVVERKGITIRVTRPVEKSKTTVRLHPSETSLDKAKFDYEIINDGSIEDLVKKVREILITEKLI